MREREREREKEIKYFDRKDIIIKKLKNFKILFYIQNTILI